MTHTQILDIFKDMYNLSEGAINSWWSYGKDTIRVRVEDLEYDLIFSCTDDRTWSLCTETAYTGWISVKERLPEKKGYYAVFNSTKTYSDPGFRYDVCLFDPDDEMVVKFWTVYSDYDRWCPLPEVSVNEN